MKLVGRPLSALFAILIIIPGLLFAQTSPAGMGRANDPEIEFHWVEISDGTVIGTTADDDVFYTVNFPSGFSFNYYNIAFNTVYVSSNGYLTFRNYGASDPYFTNDNLSGSNAPDSMIAVFWDDLILSESTARVYQKVIGVAPYRALVIEYKNVSLKAGSSPLTFQVILYETSNLIKLQYLSLGTGTNGELGGSATVGVKCEFTAGLWDFNTYSFNSPNLANGRAILFFPSANVSAIANLQPGQVAVGTNGQKFRFTLDNITTAATILQQMGKADVLRIRNPLSSPIAVVDSIAVDGTNFFFIQRATPPSVAEYTALPTIATWFYNSGNDSLYIQLPPYTVKSNIAVSFRINVPNQTLGAYNFESRLYPRLRFATAAQNSPTLTLSPGPITHYTIAPQTATITAGGSIQFTVTAQDQFGNAVINSDSANINIFGSTTAVYPSKGYFNNNSFFNFVVVETKAGTFTARATNFNNSVLTAQTGIITVNPGIATFLTEISGDTSGIAAGSNRLLRARVTDSQFNPVSGASVRFDVISGGGNFSGLNSRTVVSDAQGIAQTVFTTGPVAGLNRANATLVGSPGVFVQYDVTTVPGALSYFTVTPATFDTTAGSNIPVTVRGFDVNDNLVSNDNSTVAEFFSDNPEVSISPLSATLSAGVAGFTARSDKIGVFRLTARSQANPLKSGVSGPVSIRAAAPDSLLKFAGDGQTAPVNSLLPLPIQVQVLDQFQNPVQGVTVTFIPLSGGSVSNPTNVTDPSGIASTGWTVHNTTTPDTLAATIAGQPTNPDTVFFTATVTPGAALLLTREQPADTTGLVDSLLAQSLSVVVTDTFGNPVPNFPISFAIVQKPSGAANEFLTVNNGSTNALGRVQTQIHLGTKAGAYLVRAFSASTNPNLVDFTTFARHRAPDRIRIVGGNNQTGTAGVVLGDSLRFQLVDIYENPIADSTLSFIPQPQNGSVNPPSRLSNASGQAATTWTLGAPAGIQKMVATLAFPALTSDTAYATAQPAGASLLELLSMRQIPRDSIAAVRGENITVILRVRDAFGNPAPNVVVNFAALPGFNNTQFEFSQVTSDAQGRAINVVTTDSGNDSTFFRAFIAGVDTLELHIFHIRYAGNLNPVAVTPGNPATFSLDLENLSPNPVTLNPAATRFSFSAGNAVFSALLNDPLILQPGITTISFVPTIVDTNFANVSYAPEVFLRGSGENTLLGGNIVLPNNSLSIFTLSVARVFGSKTQVTLGDTLTLTVRVNKFGPVTVNVDSVFLNFSGGSAIPQSNVVASPANPTVLLPNINTHDFEFLVTIPGTASGSYTVSANFQGTTLSGNPVNTSSDTNFVFTVGSSANLSVLSLSPDTLTTAEPVTFTAGLINSGNFAVLLNPNFSYLAFGADTVYLRQSYSVPAGGVLNPVEVQFRSNSILSPAQAAPYPVNMRLFGIENGITFDTTLTAMDSVLVQNRPEVVVASILALTDTAAQNQDSLRARVRLTNSGALNAAARITLPQGMTLSTSQLGSIPPNSSSTFTLAAGDTTPPVEFIFSLAPNYPPGVERVKVRYSFSDVNTGKIFNLAPADSDTFVVLSRARLSFQGHSLHPDTVSPGQAGVELRFTVRNDGQSPAKIDNGDLAVLFNNPHTISLTSPASLPVVLAGDSTREFIYSINVSPNSALGSDFLDLGVSHSDTFSAKRYSDVTIDNLDTLQITARLTPAQVQIQSVQITPGNANQGQAGLQAAVQVKNLSNTIAVRIDTLALVPSRPGLGVVLVTPLPLQIAPGNTANFQFNVLVADTMPAGTVTIDAGYEATDLLFGAAISDTGAVVPATLNIWKPANFSFSPVTLAPDTASQGQGSILASTLITNGDGSTSSARVTGLQTLFSVGGDTVTATLVTPTVLPILPGGESLPVQFTLNVSDSAAAGPVNLRIAAAGLDLTNSTAFADTSAAGILVIRPRGNLAIAALVIPADSAFLGQNGVPASITVQNTGAGAVQLNAVNLLLHNAPNFPIGLQTFTLPMILNPGEQTQVNFRIDVPANIFLPNGDSTIYAGATAQGVEISSAKPVSAAGDSLDSFVIAERPDISFDALLSSPAFDIGDTANFKIQVTNLGGTALSLSSATFLRVEKANDPNNFSIQTIRPDSSDMNILAGESSTLAFEDLLMTEAGDFRLILGIRGNFYQPPNRLAFSQDLNTQVVMNVGGDVSIFLVRVEPFEVTAGDTGVVVEALVKNNTAPVSIDPGVLEFVYTDNGQQLPITATRIDTLTQVGTTPSADTLKWKFDIPFTARAGEVALTVNLTFGSGSLGPISRTGFFNISRDANVEYVFGSLAPDTVVNGQSVAFRARFINTGSVNFFVRADSSYLQFHDSQNLYRVFVNGNFVVRGTPFQQTPDTSEIAFRADSIRNHFLPGLYDVSFHIFGDLPNQDTLTALDSTFTGQLTVLSEAMVRVDSVSVVPDAVIPGQENVQIRYFLRNSGQSPANLNAAIDVFRDSLDNDVSALWNLQTQSQNFPFTLSPSGTAVLTRNFIVSRFHPTGVVRTHLRVNYNDVRKPGVIRLAADSTVYDSVRVIIPSRLFVDSLALANVPNAANGTVNFNQPYELKLVLQNSGQDPLTNITIRLFDDATQTVVFTQTISDTVLAPGASFRRFFPFTAGATSQTLRYRMSILEAISVTSGVPVTIGEPLDNREEVTVQAPTQLTLAAQPSGGGIYSQEQQFTVSFNITRSGQSPFGDGSVRIQIPADYTLISPNALLPVGPANLSGSWQVRASADTTVGPADTIRVFYSVIPPDLNTATPVILSNDSLILPVQVLESGKVKVADISLTAPPGALDSTISTGQNFRLSATIAYFGNVSPANRTARLILPPGFSTHPDSLEQTLQGDLVNVQWPVNVAENILPNLAKTAPRAAQEPSPGAEAAGVQNFNFAPGDRRQGEKLPLEEIERILGQTFALKVRARGIDGGDPARSFSDTLTQQVTVVRRAAMMMHAAVVDPPGATRGTVSTYQPFDVQIWVENQGEAGLMPEDSNYVTIKVPQGFRIEGLAPGDSLVNYGIKTGFAEADTIRIYAPETVPATQSQIRVRLNTAARDENSNQPAPILQALASFNLAVETRASLRIDNLSAGSDTLTRDQAFTLQGLITNTGKADIQPNNNVTVRLAFDTTAFRLLNPADTLKTVQLVNKQAVISWQMRTRPNANPAANPYFLTATIDSTLSWDENGFPAMGVHLEKGSDTDTLNIVEVGTFAIAAAYLNTPGIDSLTVSTFQQVQVTVEPHISGNFVNRTATLYLADIFSADSLVAPIPAAGGPISWNLQIPDTASNAWETLKVKIRGTSRFNSTLTFTDSAFLYIFPQKRAALAMHAAVVNPPGATLGTVSTHQPFDVQIWVENQGVAGVLPGDSNYVAIKVSPGFRIEGLAAGDSLLNYPLKTGLAEADTLRIYAPQSVPAAQPWIRARLDSPARDRNTGQPAHVAQALAAFNLAVETRASLRIDSLGAGLDTLIQNQAFNLRGIITNTGDANIQPNDSVTVYLDFDTTAFRLLNPADTVKTVRLVNKRAVVSWPMRSKPEAASSGNPYFFTATLDSALSWDENGFPGMGVHLEKGSDTAALNIVEVGTFAISAAYLNAPGTDSLRVSTLQQVRVTVEPQISGNFSNRVATLYLPGIFTLDSLVTPISAAGTPVQWNIQIPDSLSNAWEAFKVKIRGTSQISSAVTLTDSAFLYIYVQKRATLAVDGRIASGAVNNTVSQGQFFVYEALVSNVGQAGVAAAPKGQLTLSVGQKLLIDPDSLVKEFDLNTPVRWTIQAAENATAAALLRQIHGAKQEKARLMATTQQGSVTEGEGSAANPQRSSAIRGAAVLSEIETSRELRRLEAELSGLYRQLNALVDTSLVKVTITRRPLDINSGLPAAVEVGSDSTRIFIAEKPEITVIRSSAPAVWSTEQVGIIEIEVDAPENVIERSGILRLPEGFSFLNPADSLKAFGQNAVVNWAIRANQNIPQPTLPGILTVIVSGRDANTPPPNAAVVRDTVEVAVSVQRKALLDLASQSVSVRVLKGEQFVLQAAVHNRGEAEVQGTGQVRLNIGEVGFQFAAGETAEKDFVIDNQTNTANFQWTLLAPNFDVNTVFTLGFIQLPLDVNTQNFASVGIGSLVFDINMVSSQITIKPLDEVVEVDNSYIQGEREIGVLGAAFINPNTVETIFINNFDIAVLDGESGVPVADMHNLISRVEVVSYAFYRQQLGKTNRPPDRFGEVVITEQTANPLKINFSPVDTLNAGETDSLVIRIDLANQPISRNFRIQLKQVDASGGFVGKVNVVDSLGAPLGAIQLQSPRITLLSSDPKEIFHNYPNPFGMETRLPGAPPGVTRFNFLMENSGNAELRIFTLTGRLVWSSVVNGLPAGLHTSALEWDGRNSQGDRVVNGVYVAVLKVTYSNGGSATFQTKVVYIK